MYVYMLVYHCLIRKLFRQIISDGIHDCVSVDDHRVA